jgi:quercetin dioxygenase-like cupin family protein
LQQEISMNSANPRPAVLQPGDGRRFNLLGQTITVKLSSGETGGAYYLFENTVPPGARVPAHLHRFEDEILEVLEGELEVLLDRNTFKAPAGTIGFFPKQIVHGFSNPGSTPAKGRFLVTPGANFEKFFGELSALPADQPPDMPRIAEIFGRYGVPIVSAA